MITHLDSCDALPSADVCIVGAGAAGLEVADGLARARRRVLVLEGGLDRFDGPTQDLHAVSWVGIEPVRGGDDFGASAAGMEYRRVRQFGGTTTVWSGRWKPLTADDFVAQPWMAHAGWPIGATDLEPHYRSIAARYGLPASMATPHGTRGPAALPAPLEWSVHLEELPPTSAAARHRGWLEHSEDVLVVVGAHAQRLLLDESGGRITSVVARSLAGRTLRVAARSFVLAAGGWEVARLLLNSNRPHGIGGPHVGRGYMDHPKLVYGQLRPRVRHRRTLGRFVWRDRATGHRFRAGFCFSAAYRAAHALPHHCTFLIPRPLREHSPGAEALRGLRRAVASRRVAATTKALARVLGDRRAARSAIELGYFGLFGLSRSYDLFHYLEQLPNPSSRVYLSERLDAFGEPLLAVDLRYDERDRAAFERHMNHLERAFEQGGLGRLSLPGPALTLDSARDASHHLGLTRMAHDARDGVVDSDCRVFGTDNLFVASSAVFPLGGNANPTFTILALAERLATHLIERPLPGQRT